MDLARAKMHIYIDTIAHEEQRYPTVGDYWFPWREQKDTCIEVRVSRMGNEDYEFLVAIHEQIEAYLTKKRGITETLITNFDVEFEKNRPKGNTNEPGNDPDAPYHKEHVFATKLERMLAEELGVDWDKYDAAVNAL